MIGCGAPESVEAVTVKSVAVEQTDKAHGAPERDAQYGCMPVVSKAGNRVTWNRFLFGLPIFWGYASVARPRRKLSQFPALAISCAFFMLLYPPLWAPAD
jgi:hypothetical protein